MTFVAIFSSGFMVAIAVLWGLIDLAKSMTFDDHHCKLACERWNGLRCNCKGDKS